jgi:hypothetical protein
MERNPLRLKASLPAPLPQMFDSRCRSSTQDSFDSKFNVSTVTKQIDSPAVPTGSMQQLPDCSSSVESLSTAVQEKMFVDVDDFHTEENSWTEGMIESSPDACEMQCGDASYKVENVATSSQERSGVVSKLEEEPNPCDPSSHDADTSEHCQGVWFDYYGPHSCGDDIGSEVHVDNNDIEVDEDSWNWDDQDDWETIASTPATEVDGQLGLGEDGWAW